MARFFGQYLLEQGYLSQEQLDQASAYIKERNLPVGRLAARAQLVTPEQADHVHGLQRLLDRQWGEIAIATGLLTQTQVDELLCEQRSHSVFIGEAIANLGFLSTDRKNSLLLDYLLSESSRLAVEIAASSPAEDDAASGVLALTRRLALRTAGIQLKIGGATAWDMNDTLGVSGVISISSPRYLTELAITADTALAVALAAGLLAMEPEEVEEDMLADGLCEFLNILGGHCKNQRQIAGEIVKLGIPRTEPLPEGGVAFTIISPEGRGVLALQVAANSETLPRAA